MNPMNPTKVVVPDLGETTDVEVVEILVAPGDRVGIDDPVIVLESDKASMDLPSPAAGVVTSVDVSVGDRVEAGAVLLGLDTGDGTAAETPPGLGAGSEASGPAAGGAETGQAGSEAAVTEDPGPSQDRPPGPGAVPRTADTAAAGVPAERSGEPAAPASAAASASAEAAEPEARSLASAVPNDVDLRAEVVVLGAGPGGYTAAFRAADLGRRTVLVERYPTLGGVCLNVGCIPSKALLGTAETIAAAEALRERGVDYGAPAIDAAKLTDWKDQVVARLTGGLDGLAKRRRVEVVRGTGRFEGPHVLAVDAPDGGGLRRIGFEHAIIAAGSEPVRLPDFPWDDPRVVDSTGALALTGIPRRLLVVGGGIIGLEMAAVYDALGSQVTVVELLDELLPGCDRDLVRPLERRISARYHSIRLGTRVTAVEPQRRGLKVWFGDASRSYDRVLVAVGRRPTGVDAAAAGVRFDERGFIPVDEAQRTNVPHVFAVGDVTGPPLLAHRASHQGKVAAEAAAGRKSAFEAAVVPSVAYTDPEVAWVGVTEAAAKAEGRAVEKAVFPWAASGRALGTGRDEGLTKLLFDAESRRLVGAGIVGPHAGELIAEATLAIEMGADPEDVALSVHPHPTLSETIGFAAEMAAGTITDLYAPRRR